MRSSTATLGHRTSSRQTLRPLQPAMQPIVRRSSVVRRFQPDSNPDATTTTKPKTTNAPSTRDIITSTAASVSGSPSFLSSALAGLGIGSKDVLSLSDSAASQGWVSVDNGPLTPNELKSFLQVVNVFGIQLQPSKAGEAVRGSVSAEQMSQLQKVLARGLAKEEKDLRLVEGAVLVVEQLHMGTLCMEGQDRQASSIEPSSTRFSSSSKENSSRESVSKRAASNNDAEILSAESAKAIGTWQPLFASAGGVPRLLYIPLDEYFDFRSVDDGRVDVITEMGPIITHFTGNAKWLTATKLQYNVDTLHVDWGSGRRLLSVPFPLNNELIYFYTDVGAEPHGSAQRLGIARSKLGGTMIMCAEPQGSFKYTAP